VKIAIISGVIACGIIIDPRMSVALLVLCVVLGGWRWRQGLQSAMNLKSSLTNELAWLLISLVVWCGITIMWSLDGEGISLRFFKLAALLSLGILAISLWWSAILGSGTEFRRGFISGVAVGAAVVVVAILYAKLTGTALWGTFYFDPLTTLNSSAVILALFIWPVVMIAGRESPYYMLLPLLIVFPILVMLPSGAALAALLLGVFTIMIRLIFRRVGGVAIAMSAAFLVITAPYVISASGAERYMEPSVVNDTSLSIPYSARHRLAMWAFAAEKIHEKPLLGWGFGSSRYIPQEDRRLAPNMEIMPLHPHNLALQTRLELGLPGVMILAALVFTVFYRLATFTDDPWKSGIAMAAASGWLFVANVSYGMWQSWWIALAFLLAVLMKISFYVQPAKREIRD
jgi:O-antigen ligase